MTAIASPPGDKIVSQPAQLRTYAARRSELVLVLKPEYAVRGPSGEQVDVSPGIRIQFSDGMLRVPLKGKVTTAQGREIPAGDVLEFLDRHRLNGDRFEGFFEVPQAAPPVDEQELTQITLAIATHDIERLEQVLESERSGWGREPIIRAVEQGLAAINAMRAQFEAEQESKSAKPRPRAKTTE